MHKHDLEMASLLRRPLDLVLVMAFVNFLLVALTIGEREKCMQALLFTAVTRVGGVTGLCRSYSSDVRVCPGNGGPRFRSMASRPHPRSLRVVVRDCGPSASAQPLVVSELDR